MREFRLPVSNDFVNEEQKQKLLRYLQQHHGGTSRIAGPEKIVLRRAKTSEIKLGGTHMALVKQSVFKFAKNVLMLNVRAR